MLTTEQRKTLAQHFKRLDVDRKFLADVCKQLRVRPRVVKVSRKTTRCGAVADGFTEHKVKADKVLTLLEKLGESVDERSRLLQPFRHLLHSQPDAAVKPIRQLKDSK